MVLFRYRQDLIGGILTCQKGPRSLILSYPDLEKEWNEFDYYYAFLSSERVDDRKRKDCGEIKADMCLYMELKSFRQFE